MKGIPDGVVNLVVTSPPYDNLRNYNSYKFDFQGIVEQLYRIIHNNGIIVWVVGDKINNGNKSLTSFRQAIYFQDIGFKVHDIMIYKKKNTPFMRRNAYTNCYELMIVLSKKGPKVFNPLQTRTVRNGVEKSVFNKGPDAKNIKRKVVLKKKKTKINIWTYAVGYGGSTRDKIAFQHPAIFPENLARDHILSWTNENDLVFDPMCGSGTTCKMAKLLNRKYIGCDISEDYCTLAKARIKNTVIQKELKL